MSQGLSYAVFWMCSDLILIPIFSSHVSPRHFEIAPKAPTTTGITLVHFSHSPYGCYLTLEILVFLNFSTFLKGNSTVTWYFYINYYYYYYYYYYWLCSCWDYRDDGNVFRADRAARRIGRNAWRKLSSARCSQVRTMKVGELRDNSMRILFWSKK